MTESLKRPGRPKSQTKLTPAQKQANYRAKRGAADLEQRAALDFKKSFYYKINYRIAELEKYYTSVLDETDKAQVMYGLNELVRLKMIVDDKSNVT